jgi:hypothetical protein
MGDDDMIKRMIPRWWILMMTIAAWGTTQSGEISWQQGSSGSAYLLPERRFEVGLFQPLRYGLTESVELSTHPLLFFVMPNLSAKWAHTQLGAWTIASRHGFNYPSALLRLLAREGTGGIISPEFKIPAIFSFQNELLASTPLGKHHLFTGKLAFNFAFKSDELDSRTSIDLPIIYIRSGVYYHDYGLKIGADFNGRIYGRWMYLVDGDGFFYPQAPTAEDMAFEHKGMIFWKKSAGFQICFGYILSYGEYPFGDQWHLLPLVDLQWGWMRN